MEPDRRAWVTLDRSAIRHNARLVRQHAPNSRVMAVIKADAYGHGMLWAATALKGLVDAYAVATLEEGVTLRRHTRLPIICLSGWLHADQRSALQAHRISPVLYCAHQVDWLDASAAAPFRGDIWLKINTGMNRAGIIASDSLAATVSCVQERVDGAVRLMSHFSDADATDAAAVRKTRSQIALFDTVTQGLECERSLANSAGVLAWEPAQLEWVRPGIMLYGSSPFADRSAAELGLRPVMRFYARLIRMERLEEGQSLGYGSTWKASKPGMIGLVSAGYADGYPRHASNRAEAMVNGMRVPVVGRVSMDSLMVDLSGCARLPDLGDEVELWGEGVPVDEVARHADTISYELLCGASPRA